MQNEELVVRQYRRSMLPALPPPKGWVPPPGQEEDEVIDAEVLEVVDEDLPPQPIPYWHQGSQSQSTVPPQTPRASAAQPSQQTTPRNQGSPQATPQPNATQRPVAQAAQQHTQQQPQRPQGSQRSTTPPPPEYPRLLSPADEARIEAERHAAREAQRARQQAAEKDKRDAKAARKFIGRILFAGLCVTVFAIGAATDRWLTALVIMIALQLLFWGLIIADVGTKPLNRVIGQPFLKTNNRWLGWLALLTIITGVWLWFTPIGLPQAITTSQNLADQIYEDIETIQAEQKRQLYSTGSYPTAREAEASLRRNRTPGTETVRPSAIPDDPQRVRWHIRGWAFLVLLAFTFVYGVFFAFVDEGQTFAMKLWAWLREKSEGETAKAAVKGAVSLAPAVATTISGSPGATIAQAVGREAATQAAWDGFKHAMRKIGQLLRP